MNLFEKVDYICKINSEISDMFKGLAEGSLKFGVKRILNETGLPNPYYNNLVNEIILLKNEKPSLYDIVTTAYNIYHPIKFFRLIENSIKFQRENPDLRKNLKIVYSNDNKRSSSRL